MKLPLFNMEQIVTITRQGQLTIPQAVRRQLGIALSTKARLRTEGTTIIVEPTADFGPYPDRSIPQPAD